jgi:AcrR family transcriptional regulator
MLTPSTPADSLPGSSPMPKRAKPAKPEAKAAYHHGDLRRALIDAALELADREGLEALTTRALARTLDVSHAAPARHFPNRGALLAEVAAEAFERFSQALSRASKGLVGEETFAAMGRAYVRFALEHPALVRLMFSPELQALAEPSERLAATSTQAYEVLQAGARSALGAGASEQQVSDAAFFGWSVAHGAAALWLDGPVKHFGPKQGAKTRFLAQADHAVDVAARALARGV